MPRCFRLFDIKTREPVLLNTIDERFCTEFLNEPVHEKYYGANKYNWFDSLGYMLASNDPELHTDEFKARWTDWCLPHQQVGEEGNKRWEKKPFEQLDSKELEYFHFEMRVLEWFKQNFTSDSWWESKS